MLQQPYAVKCFAEELTELLKVSTNPTICLPKLCY